MLFKLFNIYILKTLSKIINLFRFKFKKVIISLNLWNVRLTYILKII
jgi:hypothetical protein